MPPGLGADYRVTDGILLSEEARPLSPHRHCILPESALPQGPRPVPELPDRATSPSGGDPLPEDALVIAAFAPAFHLNEMTLSLWSSVLLSIPDAVLWLQRPHPLAARNLVEALARRGVSRTRILFADPPSPSALPHAAHRDRLALADLALDALPANSPQAADFLFAGVPVLTLSGQTAAGRQTASLLSALGLADLVCADQPDLVEKAAHLAADPFRLSALRQKIERARFDMPAFDAERLCRHLEDAYDQMADRQRAGEPPADFSVAPRPSRAVPRTALS